MLFLSFLQVFQRKKKREIINSKPKKSKRKTLGIVEIPRVYWCAMRDLNPSLICFTLFCVVALALIFQRFFVQLVSHHFALFHCFFKKRCQKWCQKRTASVVHTPNADNTNNKRVGTRPIAQSVTYQLYLFRIN